jgi:uncharacterized membrane protein YhaH (DUF805 family)
MAGTTTSQFGRRGAGLARTAARKPGASGASSALQTATGWNRTAPSDLPPDMIEAIAQANRTLSSRGPAIIDRGEMAPAPSLMTMLFSANGRIRRRDYWTFNIAASLCAVLAIVSAFLLLPPMQALLAAVPISLVSLRIRSCLRIKRWHDRDKSSAWVLVGLIPFVGWLWSFVECGVLDGTPGPNRYGLSPK